MDEKAGFDLSLLATYAVLVALCELIPVPLVDRGVENGLRRRLARKQAKQRGVSLSDAEVATLANLPSSGCFGCALGLLIWPIKKLFSTFFFVLQLKTIADKASEVMHRALLLEETFDAGWLPGDADRVRRAMDEAMAKVDTRVIERHVVGVFRDRKAALNGVIDEATRVARSQVKTGDAAPALADAAERGELPAATELSRALVAAIRTAGLVPELVQWFRAAMGDVPKIARKVDGALEPAELLAADDPPPQLAETPPALEEAEEVLPKLETKPE